MKAKKNTVRKKMSMRDYITFINFIQTGDRHIDLSDRDTAALDKTEIRTMYLTPDQKNELPSFVKDITKGIDVKKLIDSVPKAVDVIIEGFQNRPTPVASVATDMVAEAQPEPKRLAAAFPHWIKDTAAKIEPSNIDAAEVVRMVEVGEATAEEMKNKFIELAVGYENPTHFLAAEPCLFEEALGDRYRYCVMFDEVIEIAAKKYEKYVAIMTEAPPSDEENADRYLTHVLSAHIPSKHPDLCKISSNADAVTSVAGNKIVFDNDDEKVLEYETAEDMEHDFLYLVYDRKIEKDAQVEIFNKKVTAIKIAQRFYKKYPHGLPDQKKFYHTRKEAFEDGALEL